MKITIEQAKCIGCGTCSALCSDYFELGSEGKAILKNSTSTSKDQLDIETIGCVKEAVECCPAQCIKVS